MTVTLFAAAVAIVSPDSPKPYETTAAAELRAYLEKCVPSGVVRVGGCRGDAAGTAVFHVGDTALARAKGLAAEQIDEDRWIIRSFGRDVVLVGGGTRGALYAVSHFLEDFCDVRWWSDREEDAPVRDSLDLPALDSSGRPAFSYRSIHRSRERAESDPRLAVRRRLNSNGLVPIPAEWGGGVEYGPPDHAHTFDMYLPWRIHGKAHPEWYSLVGGRRIGGQSDGQLCLSNPDLKAAFLEGLRRMVAKGDADARAKGCVPPRLYEVSMNDNKWACECGACMAEYEKWGRSGQYVRFVNALAAEMRKERPEIFLTMLAYYFTEEPPKGGVRAADNVIVKLCDTQSNAAASIHEPGNDAFRKLLAGWQGRFAHMFVWDYSVTFDSRTLGFPYASEFHYADAYRHYLANGVSGIFWEHEYPLVSDLWEIKFYLESRLFEDPYLDEDGLLCDAFRRYFGAAAKPAFAARRRLEEARERTKAVVMWANEFTFISDDDLAAMSALWDEAERLAKDDTTLLRRVRNARLGTDRLAEYRRKMPKRRVDGAYVADATHLDTSYIGGRNGGIVDDPESPIAGKAVAFDTEPDAHGFLSLPFAFGVYSTQTKKVVASREFGKIDASPGYHWYTLEDVAIPENAMMFFTRAWQVQAPFGYPSLIGMRFDMRVAAKFEGPEYIPGSAATNRIFIAGYELVPKREVKDGR
ncbi:MAG: DUF4838 domain-containing protein [Kiritimatiellae bacterium]|nr:DUF4838 domain-containing protein [Kiritimatiellia bacterium]